MPTRRIRAIVSLGIAVTVGLFALALSLRHPALLGFDFTWHWRAANALLGGLNPYDIIKPGGPYPFSSAYYYPLPAAFLGVPVAWMSARWAYVVAVGTMAGVLAYPLTRDGFYRLPLFLSAGYLWSVAGGQIAPLITAGMLVPSLQAFCCMKPNVGLAVWCARPSRWALAGGIALAALSFLLVPSWLTGWREAIASDPGVHLVPMFTFGGPLLALALLRWRRWEARLLLVFACVPQTMTFYDALPLMLIPATFRQALLLALASQIGHVLSLPVLTTIADMPEMFRATSIHTMVGLYLPALAMVLRRPNEREVAGMDQREGIITRSPVNNHRVPARHHGHRSVHDRQSDLGEFTRRVAGADHR